MTTTLTDQEAAAGERRDALVGRIFEAAIGFMDLATIYIGDRLGLYRALAEGGPQTTAELAARTGTVERYLREWLEQQAVTGLLTVEEAAAPAEARRYALPAGHDEVLIDADSLSYMGPMARTMIGTIRPLEQVLADFRVGAGVPYVEYGPDFREGLGHMNRAMFINLLGSAWLPAVPEIDARLRAEPPARVADFGCGTGWSSLTIARAYPTAHVDGLDVDEPSITLAQANAAATGLADRVAFHLGDAADPRLAGRYDLVTAFECVHDMGRPVEALAAMRALLAPGGSVFIADERVGDHFTAPGDEIERLNYNFSVLHCLPVGLADAQPSAGTGTVMRSGVLRGYAHAAGFRTVEVLPIEHDLWRFYRLVP